MADDDSRGDSSSGAGSFFDFFAQLSRMAERIPTMAPLGHLPLLPPPGVISAAQLSAMRSAVAAQRGSIEGLISHLRAFDEQLQVLERILGPLADWSRSWADMERTILPPGAVPSEPTHGDQAPPDKQ